MTPSALRFRLSILRPVPVEDAAQTGFTETWPALEPAPVWAAQVTGDAAERLMGQQVVGSTAVVWRLRYHRGLGALSTPEQLRCRVQHGAQLYAIKQVTDVEGRHVEHLLSCQEVRA